LIGAFATITCGEKFQGEEKPQEVDRSTSGLEIHLFNQQILPAGDRRTLFP